MQTGVKVEYKCGPSGICEIKKIDPYAEGTYKSCITSEHKGCLVDPVEYKGKVYQNICVCREKFIFVEKSLLEIIIVKKMIKVRYFINIEIGRVK